MALANRSQKSKGAFLRELQSLEANGDASREEGIECAVALLRHSDDQVLVAALKTLAAAGEDAGWYAGRCSQHLTSPSPTVRSAAARALAAFGAASADFSDQLIKMSEADQEEVRASCIVALGYIGVEGQAQRIAELVKDGSSVIAAAACQALGLLGPEGEVFADAIAARIADAEVRYAAIAALAQLGPQACEPHIQSILKLGLVDADAQTRQASSAAFSGLPSSVLEPLLPEVAELLRSQQPELRCAAALALGFVGKAAQGHVPELVALLQDGSEYAGEMHVQVGGGFRLPVTARKPKCAALIALGMIGAESEIPKIVKELCDESYEVKLCALEALSSLPNAALAASNDVSFLLEDSHYYVRVKACQCLGVLAAEDAMSSLPELFEDKAPSVRVAALEALATCPSIAESFPAEVAKCLNDPVPQVKAAAVTVLGCMGEMGKCYASLVASLLSDPDPRLQAAACEALGGMGEHGAAFAEEIATCLHSSSHYEVQEAAGAALKRLDEPVPAPPLSIYNLEGEGEGEGGAE